MFYQQYGQLKTNYIVEDEAAQLDRVTEQFKVFEEKVSKIRFEVFELKKQNKEKMLVFEDL